MLSVNFHEVKEIKAIAKNNGQGGYALDIKLSDKSGGVHFISFHSEKLENLIIQEWEVVDKN